MTTHVPASAARPADTVVDPELPVTDRGAAEAYVASVCFKHGPPRLTGVELEWLVRDTRDPTRRLDPAALARALGPHAPPTLRRPGSPSAAPLPLPRGGTVTVEPGGQVEIASPPLGPLADLLEAVTVDAAELRRRLAGEGLDLVRRAADPLRPPRRVLDVPRYAAMEAAFDRIGPHGRTMMCSTASVQVCVDAGEGPAVADRWNALHELGPVLVAVFANSTAVHGRRTGWRSTRMASWLTLDPARTSPPRPRPDADPALAYARRALDTTLLCVRRDGVPAPVGGGSWTDAATPSFGDWVDGRAGLDRPPTRADLDYHLTTMFPPVRPQGHLEVRYLDQQPGDEWRVPVAVLRALVADPAVLDRARAAVAPTVGRWVAAARDGLTDPVLHRAAVELVDLARRALERPDVPAAVRAQVDDTVARRVAAGRSPADDAVGEPGEGGLAGPGPHPFTTLGTPSPSPDANGAAR